MAADESLATLDSRWLVEVINEADEIDRTIKLINNLDPASIYYNTLEEIIESIKSIKNAPIKLGREYLCKRLVQLRDGRDKIERETKTETTISVEYFRIDGQMEEIRHCLLVIAEIERKREEEKYMRINHNINPVEEPKKSINPPKQFNLNIDLQDEITRLNNAVNNIVQS